MGLIESGSRYAAVDNIPRRSSGSSGGNSERGTRIARPGNLRGASQTRPRRMHRPVDYDSGVAPIWNLYLRPGAYTELLLYACFQINSRISCTTVPMHAAPEQQPFYSLGRHIGLRALSAATCM